VDVLAEEGTGRGAPGDALGGVGWAGEVALVAVATWIRLGGGGTLGCRQWAGTIVSAGCGWGNRAHRRSPLVEATPPLRSAQRSTSMSALRCITTRDRGAVHDRAWSGLIEESGVWQAKATSGLWWAG
jgi:hypothetical protein